MKNLLVVLIALVAFACSTSEKKTSEKNTSKAEIAEATISIGGLHCENCVASVEKGINSLEGIKNVVVTLEDSTAVVKYDKSSVDIEEIEKMVVKRGYTVKSTQ